MFFSSRLKLINITELIPVLEKMTQYKHFSTCLSCERDRVCVCVYIYMCLHWPIPQRHLSTDFDETLQRFSLSFGECPALHQIHPTRGRERGGLRRGGVLGKIRDKQLLAQTSIQKVVLEQNIDGI